MCSVLQPKLCMLEEMYFQSVVMFCVSVSACLSNWLCSGNFNRTTTNSGPKPILMAVQSCCFSCCLPMITPILQSWFLCAHDMSVPVESFRMPMTAISTSCVGCGIIGQTHVSQVVANLGYWSVNGGWWWWMANEKRYIAWFSLSKYGWEMWDDNYN